MDNNNAINDIKKYAIDRLNREYSYCSATEGNGVVMLRSGNDALISIEIKILNAWDSVDTYGPSA